MTTVGLTVLVMIKQVPCAGAFEFDSERGVLVRDGVPTEVNTYDVRAVLSALEVRKRFGGEVVVMTMGPPDARTALEHCIALGADRGVHLSDRAFAASDTLATSRVLAAAAKKQIPDIILCGRSSTDAETGNIGPQVAEWLALPQITAVTAYEIDDLGRALIATRETESATERLHVKLPALLTVVEDVAEEAVPTAQQLAAVDPARITTLTAKDLGLDAASIGAAGSPTRVLAVREGPSSRRRATYLEVDADGEDEVVSGMLDWLRQDARAGTTRPGPLPPGTAGDHGRVLVYVETLGGAPVPSTRELLDGAARLAASMGGGVDALVLGTAGPGPLASWGADRVLRVADADLDAYDTLRHAHAVSEVIAREEPAAVLFPSTVLGRDLAPRVAARALLGLVSDCVGLSFNGEDVVWDKPAFGDGVVAEITSSTQPTIGTIRPGVLAAADPQPERHAEVVEHAVDLPRLMVTVQQAVPRAQDRQPISTARAVIGVGMGATAYLGDIERLAEQLGAAVGYTRKAVDAGHGRRIDQIGLSGASIAPDLYIAIGISGAIEHAVGITRAQRILAIDADEESFMFEYADVAVIGDGERLVRRLADTLAEASSEAEEELCTHA